MSCPARNKGRDVGCVTEYHSAALTNDPQFLSCAATKFGTYSLGDFFPEANRDQVVSRWTSGVPTLRNLIKRIVAHDAFAERPAVTIYVTNGIGQSGFLQTDLRGKLIREVAWAG